MKSTIIFTILYGLTFFNSACHGFVRRHAFHHLPSSKESYSHEVTTDLKAVEEPFDPMIEAELCSTMAHVALDFTGLLSPSKSIVRLFSVVGRVFAISADYLPDHSIHTEELIIQIFLLSLSLRELLTERVAGGNITSRDSRG